MGVRVTAEQAGIPLVLITGASGYIGGYVSKDALKAGYPIRLTARPSKVEILRKEYGPTVDVVSVPDVVTGDYTEALQGVSAIIHLASPLPGTESQEMGASLHLKFALDGTMNLVRQAAAAGVKKMIICSSILAVTDMDNMQNCFDSNHTYSHKDWNTATSELLLASHHHPWWVYGATKAIAEQEVWKFAEEHPDIDFTTIQPGFVYGPSTGVSIPPRGSVEIPSTPFLLYSNIFKLPVKTGFPPVVPLHADIRDVARAHVLALSAPPSDSTDPTKRKRLLVCAPGFTWAQAVAHLRKVRPELSGRLLEESEIAKVYPAHDGVAKVDCSRMQEVLEGFGEFIPWQKTVEDCVDDLLEVEKGWTF